MKNEANKEKLLEYVCDNLCKHREAAGDQDELDDICCECEISELVDRLEGKERCFNKLGEYEDLEEQGKLLKLPCAVGDTVYELQKIRHGIQPLEIISINIGRMGETYFNWKLKDGIGTYQNVKGFGINQLGKTVFITKSAAEQALKKMEGLRK